MKTTIYLRLTKDGRIRATQRYDPDPIRDSWKKALPTVFCAVTIEIPDVAFKPPSIIASIVVPVEKVGTCIEIVDPLKMI